jgi:hypothetical protein
MHTFHCFIVVGGKTTLFLPLRPLARPQLPSKAAARYSAGADAVILDAQLALH